MIFAYNECLIAFKPDVMASLGNTVQELSKLYGSPFQLQTYYIHKKLIKCAEKSAHIVDHALDEFSADKLIGKSEVTQPHQIAVSFDGPKKCPAITVSWVYKRM
jgi:hypothetical protein